MDYMLGMLIVGLALYITIKKVKKMKDGECSCGQNCSGCAGQCSTIREENQ